MPYLSLTRIGVASGVIRDYQYTKKFHCLEVKTLFLMHGSFFPPTYPSAIKDVYIIGVAQCQYFELSNINGNWCVFIFSTNEQ